MRVRPVSGLMMIGVLGLGCAGAHAQKLPPPQLVSPGDARPSILRNKLDMSLCEYPSNAQRAGHEGCCRMKVVISVDGKAGPMSGECTDDIFYEPSKACLAPQACIPARKKGKAVKATGDIVVEYRLTTSATPPVISFLEGLFPTLKRPPKPPPEDDICKKRPDDLIAGLERLRGG